VSSRAYGYGDMHAGCLLSLLMLARRHLVSSATHLLVCTAQAQPAAGQGIQLARCVRRGLDGAFPSSWRLDVLPWLGRPGDHRWRDATRRAVVLPVAIACWRSSRPPRWRCRSGSVPVLVDPLKPPRARLNPLVCLAQADEGVRLERCFKCDLVLAAAALFRKRPLQPSYRVVVWRNR
jgi:hypothetical protein